MHIPIVIRQEARSAAKRSYALLFVISFMFLRQIYAFPVKLVRFPQIFLIFFCFGTMVLKTIYAMRIKIECCNARFKFF